MTEEKIRIKHIKVRELPQFAESVIKTGKRDQFVPISVQRAIAHAHNPWADSDDIGLLVAVDEGDEIVGYFGILPIALRDGNDIHKVYWFSTWLVSPKVRGKGVGSKLMQEALSLNQDYLIVGSVYARRVCHKFGFLERPPLIYYWVDMTGMERMNILVMLRRLYRKGLKLLGRNHKKVVLTSQVTRKIDRLLSPFTKSIFYSALNFITRKYIMGIQIEEVSELTNSFQGYEHRPMVELHRSLETINWMLKYPWVVNPGQSLTENMDYYFSDVRALYKTFGLEIRDSSGQFTGFIVFSVSKIGGNVVLKVLDYDYRDKRMENILFALAIRYGKKFSADRIEMPMELIGELAYRLLGRILLHEKRRIYQSSPKSEDSPLARSWEKLTFHLADGDMPFS
ncbi:MAG: GNAT family N-acetyltransferase [Anaerolineales bacterium]|nr:GNAT family N-acetyltransferase [Anaerolineales bacterium]